MKQSELKCPWGCKVRIYTLPQLNLYNKYDGYKIIHGCQKVGYIETRKYKTKQGVIKLWNSWMKK